MWIKFVIDQASRFVVVIGILLASTLQSAGHEVMPNIAEIFVDSKSITVELRFNADAFLARIDLSNLENTDDAKQASNYQSLRDLSADELTQFFRSNWQRFAARLKLQSSTLTQTHVLDFIQISVPNIDDPELPRISNLTIRSARLDENAITFTLGKEFGSTILRQMGVDEGLTQYLAPGQTSDPIQQYIGLRKSAFDRLSEYVPIGFDHVIPRGLDHILFVFGLFLLSLKTSILLWQISAFTLAHTVTLIAGALGLINVSTSIVEPLIAASIVFVAVENIFFSKLNKWRTLLVFSFGLLHGLGFASVLAEFGLPEGQFLPALVGFNIGVEFGQLSVIAIAYLLLGLTFGKKPYYRTVISIPASCIIAAVGTWWVFERVLLF
jgi:hydrogenase/urease accessory protein HupE